jgi:hypothetical protein
VLAHHDSPLAEAMYLEILVGCHSRLSSFGRRSVIQLFECVSAFPSQIHAGFGSPGKLSTFFLIVFRLKIFHGFLIFDCVSLIVGDGVFA